LITFKIGYKYASVGCLKYEVTTHRSLNHPNNKLCGTPPKYATPQSHRLEEEEPPRSFIRLLTLTFDLLTSDVTRGTDNLSANFWCFCDFSLSSYGQTRVKLTTGRYNLWVHRAYRWRGSFYSTRLPIV